MANPVVKIRPVARGTGHVIWCLTGDCEYADQATHKTAAQTLQRGHTRMHHAEQARTQRTEATP